MYQMPISTRREWLTHGLGLVGLSSALPNFLIRTALAASDSSPAGRILVVLQMSGGNDGLSTVVPYGDDGYAQARRAARIEASEVVKLNELVGLHPNLRGFKELLDRGELAVVQGVGYPNPNQSHFASMDIWHTADPNFGTIRGRKDGDSGWLGRYADQSASAAAGAPAVAIGNAGDLRAIRGRVQTGLTMLSPGSYGFSRIPSDKAGADAYRALRDLPPGRPGAAGNLDFVTQTVQTANATSARIRELVAAYKSPTQYPGSPLAASLRAVAALIGGGLGSRVYYVFQDGYDTHAGQRGRHDRLMTDLAESLTAFQQDLARAGCADRVLTMTFSEFGRRVRENGSQGTDHGTAGPMFLIGPGVAAGVHGAHPSLREDDLLAGRDLKFGIDFRSVYATLLEKWLGTPSTPVLYGQFPLIGCLR